MENNQDKEYITNTIRNKTGYIVKNITKDRSGVLKIEIYTPRPSYFLIFFDTTTKSMILVYWKNLGNSSPFIKMNFDQESEEILESYQECLNQFLTIEDIYL